MKLETILLMGALAWLLLSQVQEQGQGQGQASAGLAEHVSPLDARASNVRVSNGGVLLAPLQPELQPDVEVHNGRHVAQVYFSTGPDGRLHAAFSP